MLRLVGIDAVTKGVDDAQQERRYERNSRQPPFCALRHRSSSVPHRHGVASQPPFFAAESDMSSPPAACAPADGRHTRERVGGGGVSDETALRGVAGGGKL